MNQPNTSYRYTCTCPDFVPIEQADPMLPFPSRQSQRDWADSQAGAPKDADNNKGDRVCKHIWAVKLSVGDKVVVPTY
jgi:hypothetical protein